MRNLFRAKIIAKNIEIGIVIIESFGINKNVQKKKLTTIPQISQIFSKIGNGNKTHLGDGAVLEGVGDIDSRSWSDLSSSGTEKIEKKTR